MVSRHGATGRLLTTISISVQGNRKSCSMRSYSKLKTQKALPSGQMRQSSPRYCWMSLWETFMIVITNCGCFWLTFTWKRPRPPLHIGFILLTTRSKRGLDTRVSMKRCWRPRGWGRHQRGYEVKPVDQCRKGSAGPSNEGREIEWEQFGTHNTVYWYWIWKRNIPAFQSVKKMVEYDKKYNNIVLGGEGVVSDFW